MGVSLVSSRPVAADPSVIVTDRLGAGSGLLHEATGWHFRVCWKEESLQRYLLIALGGALGSMLRYFIGAQAAQRFGPRFPVGTLVINISACFLIGLSVEFLNRHVHLSPNWRLLIPVGFIGAYSTFSTFEWEIWTDFTSGAFWIGVLYLVISIVAGLLAVGLGGTTARSLS